MSGSCAVSELSPVDQSQVDILEFRRQTNDDLKVDMILRLTKQIILAVPINWAIDFTDSQDRTSLDNALAFQQAKNKSAIRLMAEWIADESGYDEEVWPRVKKAIEDNRLSHRRRFSD